MNCNEYEDFRELTPLEQCMTDHNLSEEDVIRTINALGDYSFIDKSKFVYEIAKDGCYIEVEIGYKLTIEEIDTNTGYVKLKAVKVVEND